MTAVWLACAGLVAGGALAMIGASLLVAFALGLACPRAPRVRVVYVDPEPAPPPAPRHFVMHDIDQVRLDTGPLPGRAMPWGEATEAWPERRSGVDEVRRS